MYFYMIYLFRLFVYIYFIGIIIHMFTRLILYRNYV